MFGPETVFFQTRIRFETDPGPQPCVYQYTTDLPIPTVSFIHKKKRAEQKRERRGEER